MTDRAQVVADVVVPVTRSKRAAMTRVLPYGWAVADQAVSSIGNLLLMSQLARSMGSHAFGRIASVYAVVMIVVAIVRALFSEVINSTIADEQERRTADRHARVLTLALALLIGMVGAAALSLRGPDVATLLVCALPLLLLQDRLRFEWIYRGHTKMAFVMDALWLAMQCAVLGIFATSVLSPSPTQAVAAWGVGALGSCVVAHRIGGSHGVHHSFRWGRTVLGASGALATQSLVVNVAAYGPLFVFGVLGHPNWSAGYLAASSILGIQSATLVALRPLIFRNFAMKSERIPSSHVIKVSLAVVSLSLAIGAVGIGVLALFGTQIYGQTAHLALLVSVWIAITRSVGSASSVLNGVLRSTRNWMSTLTGEVTSAVLAFALMIGLGKAFGPRLVSPAQTIAAVCSLIVWISLLRRTRRYRALHRKSAKERRRQ